MPLVFADHVWVPRAAGSIRSADPSSTFPNTSKPPSRSTTKLIRLNSVAWDSHIGSTTLPGHHGANLLRSFGNVKVLHVKTDIVRGLSRSLHSEDGEPFLELLPHLEDLTYSEGEVADATMPPCPLSYWASRAMCQWHRPARSKCYEELEWYDFIFIFHRRSDRHYISSPPQLVHMLSGSLFPLCCPSLSDLANCDPR